MSRGLVRGTDKGGKLYNYAFKPEMTIAACEIRRIVCTRKVDMNNNQDHNGRRPVSTLTDDTKHC